MLTLSFKNRMSNTINIKNKKAKFEYQFIDKYTAGIQLTGTEIKSIRLGKASIMESYGVFEKGEIFLNTYRASLVLPRSP